MASRKPGDTGTDLYVKLYGRPQASAPTTSPATSPSSRSTIGDGASGGRPVSSYWADGDRDPTKKRDIPHFFPYFYHSVLARNGKPVHGRNILALIEYIDAMLIFQGNLWISEVEDPRTGEVFAQRFCGPLDAYERLEHRPDDVIDFLWAFRATVRPGLRQFVDQTYTDLTSPGSRLLRYGSALPFDIWHQD
ncbi:hypothetical protein J2X68_000759 [Streptomyces sp. 3330]|uniref:hypothetical protein n=1 Tax=Streptomyces sp. 3330 TaxID=2817755 RepID=UPI00285BD816|nr:hypothetical protein [Streptomyces sp. 3330]MDR6974081.1 hypothetical protein [Streptomyces sp. 3330]